MFPGSHALKHQGFRNLFWGGVTSQFGDAVYYLVFLFYARKVTGSDLTVAFVAAANGLPFLLVGPWASVMADRVDRKRIMMFADLSSMAIMVAVAVAALVTGGLTAPTIIATAFVLTTVNSFFSPARGASIPRLVPPEDLQAANGFLISSIQVMQLLGLVLSVTVIGVIETIAPTLFLPITALINAATFGVSAWFCSRLPSLIPEREAEKPHVWQDLKDGFNIVRKDPVMRVALPLNAVLNGIISGWMVTYIAANEKWFGGRYWTIGLVEASFFLVILVFGIMASKKPLGRPGKLFAIGWLWCGVCVIPMAWATHYPLYLFLNAVCGIAFPASWLAISQYQQTAFPDAVRGRVRGAWETVWGASQPIGVLFIGPSLAYLGVGPTYLWMGIVITVVSAASLLLPSFRRAKMPSVEAQIN